MCNAKDAWNIGKEILVALCLSPSGFHGSDGAGKDKDSPSYAKSLSTGHEQQHSPDSSGDEQERSTEPYSYSQEHLAQFPNLEFKSKFAR